MKEKELKTQFSGKLSKEDLHFGTKQTNVSQIIDAVLKLQHHFLRY